MVQPQQLTPAWSWGGPAESCSVTGVLPVRPSLKWAQTGAFLCRMGSTSTDPGCLCQKVLRASSGPKWFVTTSVRSSQGPELRLLNF